MLRYLPFACAMADACAEVFFLAYSPVTVTLSWACYGCGCTHFHILTRMPLQPLFFSVRTSPVAFPVRTPPPIRFLSSFERAWFPSLLCRCVTDCGRSGGCRDCLAQACTATPCRANSGYLRALHHSCLVNNYTLAIALALAVAHSHAFPN